MNQDPSGGWRLSQEQLLFLEELLSEAILEKADVRMRSALEADREALKDALLDELIQLQASGDGGANGNGNGSAPEPVTEGLSILDEEGLTARVENRLKELFEDRTREAVEAIRSEASAQADTAVEIPDDLVRSRDLKTLETWVRDRLATSERKAASAATSAPAQLPLAKLVLGGVALLAVGMAAGWFALTARIDAVVAQRGQLLADMGQEAEATVQEMRAAATASDSLHGRIDDAARDVRERVGTEAVIRGLATELTSRADFVAATTGPAGPMGPVGTPPRVGISPGRFSFQNAAGATVAVVGEDETGRGHARIYGQSGASVAYLGTENGSDGAVRLRDTSGRSEISVLAGRDSSQVSLETTRGQQAFIRTRNGASAEMGVSNASGDGGVTLRSQGGFGAISVNGMSVHDFAEVFELVSRTGVRPGTVMSVAGPGGRLGPSNWAYDPSVIGVVSGAGGLQPGLTIGTREDGSQDLPVAMSGQVYVRVSGESGPIQVGDLLVASTTPGVAMRATDLSRTPGAVIGKAMEMVAEFPDGENLVRMFVMAR